MYIIFKFVFIESICTLKFVIIIKLVNQEATNIFTYFNIVLYIIKHKYIEGLTPVSLYSKFN